MNEKERARRQKERERALKEAAAARCAHCRKPVTIEDRCEDGTYLHRACAAATATRL